MILVWPEGITVNRIVSLLVLLCLTACASQSEQAGTVSAPIDVVFASGLTETLEPVDRLEQASFAQGRIYLYVRWQLSRTEHVQVTRILDGAGKVVEQREDIFLPPPDSAVPSTWVWYDFDPQTDAAGPWRFEVYIDGRKLVDRMLAVST